MLGKPQIALDIGGDEKAAKFWDRSSVRSVIRNVGDEQAVLLGYVVQRGDRDSDGISIEANRLSLNGGTISDKSGNQAELMHEPVNADSGHKVEALDINDPIVTSVTLSSSPGEDDKYGIGDTIEVPMTFSEDVAVAGKPRIELDIGDTAGSALYSSDDGSRVAYVYTVAEGDDAPRGISIAEDSLSLSGGVIEDAAGNPANLIHQAMSADDDHAVDGVRPAFESAEVSEEGDQVDVSFSEAVALSSVIDKLGDAIDVSENDFLRVFVSLTVDGEDVIASDASLSGSTLSLGLGTRVYEDQKITVTYGSILAE